MVEEADEAEFEATLWVAEADVAEKCEGAHHHADYLDDSEDEEFLSKVKEFVGGISEASLAASQEAVKEAVQEAAADAAASAAADATMEAAAEAAATEAAADSGVDAEA